MTAGERSQAEAEGILSVFRGPPAGLEDAHGGLPREGANFSEIEPLEEGAASETR